MRSRAHAAPLVGRDDDLSRLRQAMSESASGVGGAWLITGEAGIGKSRLVAELAQIARDSGAVTLTGICHDSTGDSLPYGPFLQAFRQLRRTPAPPSSEAPLQELLDLLGGRHELQRDAVQFAKYGRARVFDAADNALAALCAETPVLLMLEDVHWADRSSIDLFGFLLGSVVDRRLLITATYREDELPPAHPLQRALLELSRQALLNRLRLASLPEQAMATLLAVAVEPDDPAVDNAGIIRSAGGNPFFALELLYAAAAGRAAELPETIREAVTIRLAALSPSARDRVRLAAVAGEHVRHATLELASGSGGIDDDIRQVVSANLMRIDDEGDGYTFRHALVRDVVYADLLPGERQGLHATVAEALSSEPRGVSDAAALAEQAYHWRLGQRWSDAIRTATRAGDAAALINGYPEAAEQYERVLDMWSRISDPEEHAGCSRDEVTIRAAEATRWAGHADHALALVRSAIDPTGDAAPSHDSARLLERSGRYQWEMGDTANALLSYELAGRAAVETGSAELLASVLAARAAGLIYLGRFGDAAVACDEALGAVAGIDAVRAHVLATAAAESEEPVSRGARHEPAHNPEVAGQILPPLPGKPQVKGMITDLGGHALDRKVSKSQQSSAADVCGRARTSLH